MEILFDSRSAPRGVLVSRSTPGRRSRAVGSTVDRRPRRWCDIWRPSSRWTRSRTTRSPDQGRRRVKQAKVWWGHRLG